MLFNRSFSRRIGKRLSQLQKTLLDYKLPKYLFSNLTLIEKSGSNPCILEIGIGMGEHFVHQASLNPDTIFIGAEVYLNGIANVLKLSEDLGVSNFLLWPNDIDMILENLPNNSLQGIYLLFPDPWTKRKQIKKRFFNEKRLNILTDKLRKEGFFIFASDIDDYFNSTKKLFIENGNFKLITNNFTQPHESYLITKYHKKANEENREAKFLQFIKN